MSLAQWAYVGFLALVSLAVMAIVPYLIEMAPSWTAAFRRRYVQRPAQQLDARRALEQSLEAAHASAPARPGATYPALDAPPGNAVRDGAEGACVRAEDEIWSFLRTDRGQEVVRRMVRHNITNPQATKEATIVAGFAGEIKGRSGDPRSKYQRLGSPLYTLFFGDVPSGDPAARIASLQSELRALDGRQD